MWLGAVHLRQALRAAQTRTVRDDEPSLHIFERRESPVEGYEEHEAERNPRQRDELGPSNTRDPYVLAGIVDLLDAFVIDIGDDRAPD